LTDLCAVHYPNQAGRELALFITCITGRQYPYRFKVFTPIAQPDVFTATQLYSAANWMNGNFDFFG